MFLNDEDLIGSGLHDIVIEHTSGILVKGIGSDALGRSIGKGDLHRMVITACLILHFIGQITSILVLTRNGLVVGLEVAMGENGLLDVEQGGTLGDGPGGGLVQGVE